MKTDAITIYSDLRGREQALDAAERFSSYNDLAERDAMHIRLLTEEVLCLVHGIMDEFHGQLWLESEQQEQQLVCRIHLKADDCVTEVQENELLAVSTSGKNENAKGILGKIRELVRISAQRPIVSFDGSDNYEDSLDEWYAMGIPHNEGRYIDDYYVGYWSLEKYRDSVKTKSETSSEEKDELERSIIAKLSDDVNTNTNTNEESSGDNTRSSTSEESSSKSDESSQSEASEQQDSSSESDEGSYMHLAAKLAKKAYTKLYEIKNNNPDAPLAPEDKEMAYGAMGAFTYYSMLCDLNKQQINANHAADKDQLKIDANYFMNTKEFKRVLGDGSEINREQITDFLAEPTALKERIKQNRDKVRQINANVDAQQQRQANKQLQANAEANIQADRLAPGLGVQ